MIEALEKISNKQVSSVSIVTTKGARSCPNASRYRVGTARRPFPSMLIALIPRNIILLLWKPSHNSPLFCYFKPLYYTIGTHFHSRQE